jgi:hypothetical protein
MNSIKNILSDLRIKSGKIHNPSYRVDPNYWRMYISSVDHKSFIKKIGSWHPRKMNIFRERMEI